MADRESDRLEFQPQKFRQETQAILDKLQEYPTLSFQCIHGDGPAVSICEVPDGCVVFPGIET